MLLEQALPDPALPGAAAPQFLHARQIRVGGGTFRIQTQCSVQKLPRLIRTAGFDRRHGRCQRQGGIIRLRAHRPLPGLEGALEIDGGPAGAGQTRPVLRIRVVSGDLFSQ